jgi:hypothetical protein
MAEGSNSFTSSAFGMPRREGGIEVEVERIPCTTGM